VKKDFKDKKLVKVYWTSGLPTGEIEFQLNPQNQLSFTLIKARGKIMKVKKSNVSWYLVPDKIAVDLKLKVR